MSYENLHNLFQTAFLMHTLPKIKDNDTYKNKMLPDVISKYKQSNTCHTNIVWKLNKRLLVVRLYIRPSSSLNKTFPSMNHI